MAARHYVVTADQPALADMSGLEQRLREAGFAVRQRLDAAGVFIVSADDDRDDTHIRRVSGVASVEEEREYRRYT